MDDKDEFLALCDELKRGEGSENPPSQPPPPSPLPKMELTTKQKLVVLKYVLAGPGKGLFEDCEEFWEDVPNIEESYPALRQAAEDYLDGVKRRLLGELE